MHIRMVIVTISLLIASGAAVSRPTSPSKLEGMDYDQARSVILGYGWKPFSGECNGVSKNTCKTYPEINSCQGVAPGYCAMSFAKQDRCLSILTLEAPPGPNKDTIVQSVTFHAQCVSDSENGQ
jgi:hypothetical protein